MKHLSEKKILLYRLDELSVKERRNVEAHIQNCSACRTAVESEKTPFEIFRAYPTLAPDQETIDGGRNRLIDAILKERAEIRQSIWQKAMDLIPETVPTRSLAAALCTFVMGLLLGRSFLTEGSPKHALLSQLTANPLSNIEVIPVAGSDEIEIRFQSIQSNQVQGKLSDTEIQYLLSYTLINDHRDNIRLKSVNLLEESFPNAVDFSDVSDDEFLQSALIHTLERDTNPGVRLKAVRLLKKLPASEPIQKVMLYALYNDPVQGIRNEAARALNAMSDPKIDAVLKHRAGKEDYVNSLIGNTSLQDIKDI